MFAVIKTGGKQYKVQEGEVLHVEKLSLDEGQEVNFDEVLLIDDGENTLIGTPYVENAQVKAVVVRNFKDKNVIVFKKKRRKQYRKTKGHRQNLTEVKIEKILSKIAAPAKKKTTEKKEKKPAPVKPDKKVAAEAPKKAAAKKPDKPEKKEAAVKAPAKKTAKTEAKPPAEKKAKPKAPAKKKTEAKAPAKPKKTALKKEK
jgi:large subunit ribosomal protein L21